MGCASAATANGGVSGGSDGGGIDRTGQPFVAGVKKKKKKKKNVYF